MRSRESGIQKEVGEVDLRRLLGRGGMLLQDRTDTDGRRALPEHRVHHLPGDVAPRPERLAVGVGVGEEHDLTPSERAQLVGLQLTQSACRQPDVLRIVLRQDDCRLLGLYDGHVAARRPQQMQAEEAVCALVPAVVAVPPFQEGVNPGGVVRLIPVTVGAVVHHLTVVSPPLMVYLPEDDAALSRGPEEIAAGGVHHLQEREIAVADHRLAELTVDRQALLNDRGGMVERKRLAVELFPDVLERTGR